MEEKEREREEMERQKLGDPHTDRETNGNAGEMEREMREAHGERAEGMGTRWRQSVRRGMKVSVLKKSLQRR